MRLQPVKTGNLGGDLAMLNKDMEYKKYLDSVFEKTDEYYYINLETKEVTPSYMSTNGIDGCSLNYIFKDNILRNIQGDPIIETEVDSVYNSSSGIFACGTGSIIHLFNGIIGKEIYKSPNSAIILTSYKGYNLLEISTSDSSVYEYALINPLGEKVFSTKRKDDVRFKLFEQEDHLMLRGDYSLILLYADKIILPEGKLRNDSPIRSIKSHYCTSEIVNLLNCFQIPKDVQEQIIFKYLGLKPNIRIRYNASFLEIFYEDICGKRVIVATRNGKILYNDLADYIFIKRVETIFNDETIMIPSSLDKKNDLVYYDKEGHELSRFINVEGFVKVDKIIANLYKLGKLTELRQDYTHTGSRGFLHFKINDKFYRTESYYSCGRLKIMDETTSLFGYLDGFGNILIEPQYNSASDFYYGTAEVMTSFTKYKSVISTNGESLSYLDEEQRKKFNNHYRGFFEKIYNLPVSQQLAYLFYQETENFLGGSVYYYYDIKTCELKKSKYEPVRQYQNYLICIHYGLFPKSGYYALDKRTDKKTFLGYLGSYTYFDDDYFVVNDTTYYPLDELINLGHFSLLYRKLKDGIKLLSQKEYLRSQKLGQLKEKLDEKSPKEMNAVLEKERVELLRIKKEYMKLEEEKALLQNKIKELEARQRKLHIKHILPLPADFFLLTSDFKYINPHYLKDLRDYDLMMADFTDCMLRNINLSGTNAIIDPQKVYEKDLSNSNLSEVTLINYDFQGVRIENTIFTDDFAKVYQEDAIKLKRTLKK